MFTGWSVADNIERLKMKSVKRIVKSINGFSLDFLRPQVSSLEESKTATAKPWSEMPQPPRIPFLGSIQFMNKQSLESFHMVHSDLKKKYGDIYKINILGKEFVYIHNPVDVETLHRNDGTMPNQPLLDGFIEMRKTDLAKCFPETTGLMAHNDEWFQFRKAVQQDMMRPKTAFFYIQDIEDIALELNDIIASNLDSDGMTSIGHLSQKFALESIGVIFIGKRLGVLQGSEERKLIIDMARVIFETALPIVLMPFALARQMKFYREGVAAWSSLIEVLSANIQEVIDKMDIENESDDSVLSKLVRKHGKSSQIPLVMSVDALFAGKINPN